MSVKKKNIFAIIGSASENSANQKLVEHIAGLTQDVFDIKIFKDLKTLPHFNPEFSTNQVPASILEFRNNIEKADGILISTPEYIFSIPSGLKNAIEWCVATVVFTDKPTGLITASAKGEKGKQELELIMRTLMAKFSDKTTLLIPGVKGKIDAEGKITDEKTVAELDGFIKELKLLTAHSG